MFSGRHKLSGAWKGGASAGARARCARGLLLGVLLAVLATGGCAASPHSEPRSSTGSSGQLILQGELDELTRAFADRYVGLLSSTCDALKRDNPDLVQRREIQELTLNCATNVYDIASNADAVTRMLDLVVVTTLVSQVWIDDNRAEEVFGDRAEVLIRALHHGRVEAWALAAQVLRPDQLDLLDYLIWDWRRHNPDMVRASFVRFSNFAVARGRSAEAEVVAAGGLFRNVGQAGQSIDQARLLSERMFYLFKRVPSLMRWELAAMKDDLVATPEIDQALADVHRLSDSLEQLPGDVAAERKAILAALDQRMKGADEVLIKVRGALSDAKGLVSSMGRTSKSVDQMLKTAEPLFARFDAWDRWSSGLPGHRSFDVREYTQGMKELTAAVQKMHDVMKSSNQLLASSEWDQRIEQLNQSADGRIHLASEQSQRVVVTAFRQTCFAIGLFFAMLILYRLTTIWIARRLRLSAGADGVPGKDNGKRRDLPGPAHPANRGGLS